MDIEEYQKKHTELQQAADTFGRTMILDAIKGFFDRNPTVTAIKWVQYIPGFNDGEPCTFSMGDLEIAVGEDREYENHDVDMDEGILAAWRLPDDLFERVFGVNVEIEIDRDLNVTSDYYDCGY